MNLEWAGLLALTVLDTSTVIIIFICALNARMLLLPVWYRAGLIAAALGFAAQNAMNLPYLLYGIEIDNNPLIFRAMKDVGIAMVASHYFWQVIRGRRKLGAPLTSMRSKKMRTDGHSTHKPRTGPHG
ncbi:Uncharacterised protein [Campylobacter jejuni]|jgi:hypothetical protein|uniref:hypothetical protein n=1 Tax=Rahnella victoriana TaxID=1510570 RepID=UPI000BB169BF|nr:hypothetical protein [Rahnella victoriana]PBI81385.1 hypothetical protein A9993_17390 [Rahnella victoriana]VTQ66220.1 Uncharacterised protein [Campylobacter jejuni]